MSDIRSTDPQLLLEAARVFNAAGRDYRGAAEVVAELALESKDKAEPPVRQAIIGDAAALRLSGRVLGGYRAALELLNGTADTKEADPEGRLHLLRALANGQKYKEARRSGKPSQDPELEAIRGQIRKDLIFAFEQNPTLRSANQHFWQPTSPSMAAGGDREDDLWDVFQDDPEFRTLASPAADGNTHAEPPAGGGDRQP
jgi:hypothetical protein